MAGFGFTNFTKPGKGVDKNGPEKKSFFAYWEVYFRNFTRLMLLSVIFLAFCLPISTIGPALCGLHKVMKDLVNGRGVFLFADFWKAFKENLKHGILFWLLDAVVLFFAWTAAMFYRSMAADNAMYCAKSNGKNRAVCFENMHN